LNIVTVGTAEYKIAVSEEKEAWSWSKCHSGRGGKREAHVKEEASASAVGGGCLELEGRWQLLAIGV
jgi:hypothetical protein